jgi:O-acetyl-ADP-ribose deacetylase (regulator of RNase III)
MIEYKSGSILTEDVEALVNTVNCVGVMGRGIALQFKNAFPANYKAYASACKRGEVVPGRMFVYETAEMINPRFIINFPTKRHWKGKSRLEDIDTGLTALKQELRERDIRSIAIPPLGCGLGGLDWKEVKPRIEMALSEFPEVKAIVYEPQGFPIGALANISTDVPRMTPGRAALVSLIERYLSGLLDPFITLLEVHKLMYFLQEAGEPLRLRYIKADFGPYAENLRHVLLAIEGHLTVGYQDGGDAPGKQISLVPAASADSSRFLSDKPETIKRIERVAELVDGFETPFGLELLSTVHWVIRQDSAMSLDKVIDAVYRWNERKKLFSPRQIKIALDALVRHGWVPMIG